MARIRTIKPEFFTDADVGELPPLHRLLFIGLWTQADREGRLFDRPKDIKVRVLPFDKCDPEKLLGDLDRAGFIHRYEVQGIRCIQVCGFDKHQRPHPKESVLGLPTPPSREISRQEIKPVESSAGKGKERKGKEGEGKEGNGGTPTGSDVLAVLPAEEFEMGAPAKSQAASLRALWNELTAPPIPRWEDTGKARAELCEKALARRPVDGPKGWREVFRLIGLSAFCRGENDRGWRAYPEWALRPEGKKPETASKLLEGHFSNGPPIRAGNARDVTKGMVRAQDVDKAAFAKTGTLDDF